MNDETIIYEDGCIFNYCHPSDEALQKSVDNIKGDDTHLFDISSDTVKAIERLTTPPGVRVSIIGTPNHSVIAAGIVAHTLIEDRLHTVPLVGQGIPTEEDCSAYIDAMQKMSDEQSQLPILELKNFAELDQLSPVDTYKPERRKKRPGFRDKKYF